MLILKIMIRRKEEKKKTIEIDLTGPDGNSFVLMSTADSLARRLGYDRKKIVAEMMSGDYEHLLSVFVEYFPFVTLWR